MIIKRLTEKELREAPIFIRYLHSYNRFNGLDAIIVGKMIEIVYRFHSSYLILEKHDNYDLMDRIRPQLIYLNQGRFWDIRDIDIEFGFNREGEIL